MCAAWMSPLGFSVGLFCCASSHLRGLGVQHALRGCPWNNQLIDYVCVNKTLCLKVRLAWFWCCLPLLLSTYTASFCSLRRRKFVLPLFFSFFLFKMTESRSCQNIYGNSSFFRLEISLLIFGSTNLLCLPAWIWLSSLHDTKPLLNYCYYPNLYFLYANSHHKPVLEIPSVDININYFLFWR